MRTSCFVTALQLSDTPIEVKVGLSIAELLKEKNAFDKRYIGVIVNNEYENFEYIIHKDSIISFITVYDFEGERIFRRTITMVLEMAVKSIMPSAILLVRYSIPGGMNFSLEGIDADADYSDAIISKMQDIINGNMLIGNNYCHNSLAEDIFRKRNRHDILTIMETSRYLYYNLSVCGDNIAYYYGNLAHSTGYIKSFDVIKFRDSYLIYHPHTNIEQCKKNFNENIGLYDIVYHYKCQLNDLGANNLGHINKQIIDGNASDIVKIAEAQQNKQFVELSTHFHNEYGLGRKIILISGPSSSGKTTFSYKLRIMLKTYGINTHILSMDNYFINREDIPVDKNGDKDFERFENVDLHLFNQHLNELLNGKTISIPKYDFGAGARYFDGTTLSLNDGGVVLIEGIHALNPSLVADIDNDKIFKIFLSPLSPVSMDNTTFFNIDDNRLIRRIIRDSKFRDYPAANTLKMWGNVRLGERKNIFPYQNQANFYFNTSLFYELNVLKPFIVKLLIEVNSSDAVYAEAQRLLHLMELFVPIEDNMIPSESILREFIGGSSFEY